MKLETTNPLPAQSASLDELCPGLLYIEDIARCRAVYASDDWVDIQDFWLAADSPRDNLLVNDLEYDSLPAFIETPQKVVWLDHLRGPSYAFKKMVFDVAYRGSLEVNQGRFDEAWEKESAVLWHKLTDRIFNKNDLRFDRRNLLVAKSQVTSMADGRLQLPEHTGAKTKQVYMRVAATMSRFINPLAITSFDLSETES
jgi:hypothetical protein